MLHNIWWFIIKNKSMDNLFKTCDKRAHNIGGIFHKGVMFRKKDNIYFYHLYWSIIGLQWCVTFCSITKWISYTYNPISPPSCFSFPPSLTHPSRWSQSTELISLCYVAASHKLSILHLVVCICPCHSLTLSQLTIPPPPVLKYTVYVCVFISVLA